MRCWGAKSDVNDGRALELGSERGEHGAQAAFLEGSAWGGGSASEKPEQGMEPRALTCRQGCLGHILQCGGKGTMTSGYCHRVFWLCWASLLLHILTF